jgi:transcriptional regulator
MREPLSVIQGTLELLALRSVSARGPVHGFEILDWIRQATDDALTIEDGALYPALRRMEKRGWISSAWGVSEKGRRARYYTITPAGRRALTAEDRRWKRYVDAVAKLSARAADS